MQAVYDLAGYRRLVLRGFGGFSKDNDVQNQILSIAEIVSFRKQSRQAVLHHHIEPIAFGGMLLHTQPPTLWLGFAEAMGRKGFVGHWPSSMDLPVADPIAMQSDQFQLHAEIEQRHWWFVGRRRILQRLVAEVLPPSPQTTLIDVGCGTGGNIAALAGAYRGIGIDTSGEAIALASRRFPKAHFLAGCAPNDLGEWAGQASLFMLCDVLEHVSDDFALFSELLAAARPGCYFLVTVPADESLWSEHDTSFGHYRRYTPARLELLWSGLPATALLVSYFNARLLPVIRGVRWWTQRRGHAAGNAGTDFWVPNRPANALLTALFAGEARRLAAVLHGRKPPYRSGASLVALLRREEGEAVLRRKPGSLPPDRRA